MKETLNEVNDRLDLMIYEKVKLREDVDDLKKKLNKNETIAIAAAQKANVNEQYSRKNNIKIMCVVEDDGETEDSLTKKLQHVLETKTGIILEENKIWAPHRIPGKSGMPKPVLLKLKNNK